MTLHICAACVDAAKRRQLPAWIREGLEKMEREKQRAMEKERQIQDAMNVRQLQGSENQDAAAAATSGNDDEVSTAAKSRFVCLSVVVSCNGVVYFDGWRGLFHQQLCTRHLHTYCFYSDRIMLRGETV